MKMKTKITLFAWDAMRFYPAFFVLLLLGGMVLASPSTAAGGIKAAMKAVCCLIDAIIPFLAFTLFVIAGGIYGAGQFFGAETRSKASGYAMTAITGAIIMLVIYLIGPSIIDALYGSTSGQAGNIGTGRCTSIVSGACPT
jgi:hypothetical protein